MENTSCDLCGEDDYSVLFKARDWRYGFPGFFRIVQCKNCGLVYTNPRPSKLEMAKYYPPDYCEHQAKVNRRSISEFLLNSYMRMVAGKDPLNLGINRTKKRVLDVGCGSGLYLKRLKDAGYKCYGVDTSALATQRAQALGLNVFTGELSEAIFPDNYFDIIVLKYVLEHVHSPSKTLKECNRILKDEGILIISVPNFESFSQMHFKADCFQLDVPRHLYHFTRSTLDSLLRKHGFNIIRIHYNPQPEAIVRRLDYIMKETSPNPHGRISKNIAYALLLPTFPLLVRLRKTELMTVCVEKSDFTE